MGVWVSNVDSRWCLLCKSGRTLSEKSHGGHCACCCLVQFYSLLIHPVMSDQLQVENRPVHASWHAQTPCGFSVSSVHVELCRCYSAIAALVSGMIRSRHQYRREPRPYQSRHQNRGPKSFYIALRYNRSAISHSCSISSASDTLTTTAYHQHGARNSYQKRGFRPVRLC